MPSIYGLKPSFQNLLRPLTNALARVGISANQITLAAMAGSFATGVVIFLLRSQSSLLLLPIVLLVRMALNAIDGMLAREHNQKTALGAILNELGDVFSDSALYLPLAVIPGFSAPLVLLIVLCSGLTEMTGVIGVQIGASRRYDGPMGKSDRAFVFGALGLLLGLNLPIVPVVQYVLWLVLVLLLVTVVNRARRALAEVQGSAAR
jgi:CDP-diacylglycerol---glycerol-3-phosphate 3-phosphatidyltransferase